MGKKKPVPAPNYTVGYMCMVDFDCELGNACGGNTVYPSIDDLKKNRRCVSECGIVEVHVHFSQVIQKEKRDV